MQARATSHDQLRNQTALPQDSQRPEGPWPWRGQLHWASYIGHCTCTWSCSWSPGKAPTLQDFWGQPSIPRPPASHYQAQAHAHALSAAMLMCTPLVTPSPSLLLDCIKCHIALEILRVHTRRAMAVHHCGPYSTPESRSAAHASPLRAAPAATVAAAPLQRCLGQNQNPRRGRGGRQGPVAAATGASSVRLLPQQTATPVLSSPYENAARS